MTYNYRRNILVTGSACEETIELLKKTLPQHTKKSEREYTLPNQCSIYLNCDLNKSNFCFDGFKTKCNQIRDTLEAIIFIVNLNPRPETLLNDLSILSCVFTPQQLREKVIFFFTMSNGISKSLFDVRNSFLKFNEAFDFLNMEKNRAFVNNRVWLLNDIYNDEMKSFLNLVLGGDLDSSYNLQLSAKCMNLFNKIEFEKAYKDVPSFEEEIFMKNKRCYDEPSCELDENGYRNANFNKNIFYRFNLCNKIRNYWKNKI